jgi:hypothetical protein
MMGIYRLYPSSKQTLRERERQREREKGNKGLVSEEKQQWADGLFEKNANKRESSIENLTQIGYGLTSVSSSNANV